MRRASGKLTTVDVTSFVLAHLPPPPARVLEVGCGHGELARAISAAGYDVTAIDPDAPDGPIFRRIRLEEVGTDERFDAVVSKATFHHIGDLDAAFDRVIAVLRPGGAFILDEFGWDRFDARTADWYDGQRRVLIASRGDDGRPSAAAWRDHHAGNHTYEAIRSGLDARFDERVFEWRPYLYRYLGGVATEELERSLIDAGAINAIGFRYVGMPRRASSFQPV
jgi:SAM-dependent methyltransferase